jgi:hypothetical protein
MSMSIRDKYVQYRTDPDNDEKSLSHFVTKFGYSLDEAKDALKHDKSLEKDILDARRKKYAKRMQKIDDALFRSAETGDTRAADLLYRRFDGWDPKVVEQTNNFYNFTDIVREVHDANKSVPMKRKLPSE